MYSTDKKSKGLADIASKDMMREAIRRIHIVCDPEKGIAYAEATDGRSLRRIAMVLHEDDAACDLLVDANFWKKSLCDKEGCAYVRLDAEKKNFLLWNNMTAPVEDVLYGGRFPNAEIIFGKVEQKPVQYQIGISAGVLENLVKQYGKNQALKFTFREPTDPITVHKFSKDMSLGTNSAVMAGHSEIPTIIMALRLDEE